MKCRRTMAMRAEVRPNKAGAADRSSRHVLLLAQKPRRFARPPAFNVRLISSVMPCSQETVQ
jgi:hypothetical protein